ncbi:hypothetical protein H2248_002763 [Termitomyces sp. 'cryptogamus']|nr:hypothetical protein H2248_002763 [Termitomyces sp. 'cryptogamus']
MTEHGLQGTALNAHIAAGKSYGAGRPWHRHDLRAITTGAQAPVQPRAMLSAEQSLNEQALHKRITQLEAPKKTRRQYHL